MPEIYYVKEHTIKMGFVKTVTTVARNKSKF